MLWKTLPLLLLAALLPDAGAADRVYELRTYTTLEGRLPALLARFRNHTTRIFEKHGMINIGYWVPQDPPKSQNTLIYILSHASVDAAKKSWDAFRKDPEWLKARDASEKDGKIVEKVESVFLSPADFSKLK
jgi:NIPSNAP protein